MQPKQKRRTMRGWEQLELLGPRPQLPQWSALPQSVRHEATQMLARMLRQADGAADGGGSEEVGDE